MVDGGKGITMGCLPWKLPVPRSRMESESLGSDAERWSLPGSQEARGPQMTETDAVVADIVGLPHVILGDDPVSAALMRKNRGFVDPGEMIEGLVYVSVGIAGLIAAACFAVL